jgi:two-component system sensor histidine kinase CiaH
MFRSVRLKLTLINISVVGVILLIFFSGIYILMEQDLMRQSEQLMRAVAGESRFRPPKRFPVLARNWANCFYIRIDKDGVAEDVSVNIPIAQEEQSAILRNVLSQSAEKGTVKYAQETYRFQKSTFPEDQNRTIVVFMNTQQERETLARLKTVLIFIGLAGIIVVFVCSLFLAGRALIPIKKSWERQRNFVADASHELRSPLAVIETNLELVLGNSEETVESQKKWLGNIQAENRRMSKLVSDLLFLARADSNQQMFEKRFFPLQDVLMEAVLSMQPLALKKNITLEANIKQAQDFFGDEARIKQLAVILIDNAIKYTQPGGLVQVALALHESHVEITVADNGEGIAREHLHRIFERFYRVEKARPRESGGTGLGLSIADWIVKEHRGTISVSSAPGKGATFKVILPKALIRNR